MNSSCVREGVLQAFLDGELDEQQELAAHVSRCPRCASTLQELKERTVNVEGLLASLADEPLQPAVVALPRRSWPRWTLAGAALAACLVIGTPLLLRLMKPAILGTTRAGTTTAPTNAFILQPGAVQPLPTEALMIVRVKVPVSAVPPDATTRLPSRNPTVLADVLMGEDGTTYGMRLADTGGY
jgi:anti-sigma factor RsiW